MSLSPASPSCVLPIGSPPSPLPASHPRPTVTVRRSDDRLCVDKRRTGPSAAALTAIEARWLRDAAGPGVAVVERHDTDAGRLVTVHAGPRTLASAVNEHRLPPTPVVAGWLLTVVQTLDRLHRAGLVHGQLRPDHVVVAGRATTLVSPRCEAGSAPSDDLDGFASLLTHVTWVWTLTGTRDVDVDAWRRLADLIVGGGIASAARAATRVASISRGPG